MYMDYTVYTAVAVILLPLLFGYILDLIFGDPISDSHPIVWFGISIDRWERRANKPGLSVQSLRRSGSLMAYVLTSLVFIVIALFFAGVAYGGSSAPGSVQKSAILIIIVVASAVVFYSLSGTTLRREVRRVFLAVDRSLEEGREQVARVVGRDTSKLSAQQVRLAALETEAESMNDGVVAPLYYYLLGVFLGSLAYVSWGAVAGVVALAALPSAFMGAFKMVNTLDSMVGYRTERFVDFGRAAAIQDDNWGYIPARLTAWLMLLSVGKTKRMPFVQKYGRAHLSPNSGYPEAAMAAILDCRFGGPNEYFGVKIFKPYIGENDREIRTDDARRAERVSFRTELLMVVFVVLITLLLFATSLLIG